jgi:transglutaminase-like putative cysteine protease
VDQRIDRLEVRVSGQVLTEDRAGMIGSVPGELPPEIFLRPTPLTGVGDALGAFGRTLEEAGGSRLDLLHRLAERIYTGLSFDTEATGVGTSADQAFAAGHGVCQDFTHIFIAVARGLGIPARYVSGHLFRRDGASLQPATHAWAEAHDPDLGWVAFDPTHGISADDAYVRVACGLDYRDAAPFSGSVQGGGKQEMRVAVDVREVRQQQQQQR